VAVFQHARDKNTNKQFETKILREIEQNETQEPKQTPLKRGKNDTAVVSDMLWRKKHKNKNKQHKKEAQKAR